MVSCITHFAAVHNQAFNMAHLFDSALYTLETESLVKLLCQLCPATSPAIWQDFINTLRPRQNRRHFADDVFKYIFLNENAQTSLKISLKFVPKVRINNISALVQIMAWRRPGDKPLSEPMMVNLLTHICVTRPQWVKTAPVPRPPAMAKLTSQQLKCFI